jgi:xanthine/uracil permease
MSAFGWNLYGDGRTPPPGAAVRPDAGAILVAGVVLAAIGAFVHFAGSEMVNKVLPPAVTGAVVMLIGFNLAPVVAGIYWPQRSTTWRLTIS